MDQLTGILVRIEASIKSGIYESMESDWLEIKPVPSTGGAWDSIRESICAFLNSRGGVVVLGVREEQKRQDEQKPLRRFIFTGYDESNSGNISQIRMAYTDGKGNKMDVTESLIVETRPFISGQIAIVRVGALPEDRKYCYYNRVAYERIADRDERIQESRTLEQEERKREMETFRELRPVDGAKLDDLDLQRLNELIVLINQGQSKPIETIKSSLVDAVPFLEKKRFMLQDGQITLLGMLVCGKHPADDLLFRSHLDAMVDVPNEIAQDKKTFRDNILQIMEYAYGWTLRNIMTGVSPEAGGRMAAEYPETLIRESINNALAHRDYSINRPVQITIKPHVSLSIRNPGHLPHDLVFECLNAAIPVRRIFANPRARNPRLADILKLHSKWEGKGIGMSDLVNCALANQIDLPYYLFHTADELSLCVPAGKVFDENMDSWFDLLGGFISRKSKDSPLTDEHRIVLAYLLKSERANRNGLYTLALTPGNNHFGAINELKDWGLIELHPDSDRFREVYVVCREMAVEESHGELRALFGRDFDRLDDLGKQTLNMIALAERFSHEGGLNAKQVSRLLKTRMPSEYQKRGEDEFYRALRRRVERMAPEKKAIDLESTAWHATQDKMLSIRGPANRPIFRLNRGYQTSLL